MDIERSKRPIKAISLVPLINVIFLLLIFFMVAGTVKDFDVIDVELPEAVSGEVLDEGSIVFVLGRYDEIILNDRPIVMEGIEASLGSMLQGDNQRVITVKADSRMKADRLIAIMDHIKAAGGVNVSFITQQM